jgi:hypothetical protein
LSLAHVAGIPTEPTDGGAGEGELQICFFRVHFKNLTFFIGHVSNVPRHHPIPWRLENLAGNCDQGFGEFPGLRVAHGAGIWLR